MRKCGFLLILKIHLYLSELYLKCYCSNFQIDLGVCFLVTPKINIKIFLTINVTESVTVCAVTCRKSRLGKNKNNNIRYNVFFQKLNVKL